MILNVCHRGDKVLDKVGGYTDCKSQPMSEAQRVIHLTGWCCCVKTAPGTSSTLTWALRPDQGVQYHTQGRTPLNNKEKVQQDVM